MFRPPVGSGRGDEDESGRRRHSSRVKFLPLAWAGMPKTSFRKNSDSPLSSFNGASMFIKAAYTGSKTGVASLNIVMASWDLATVKTVAPEDILMMAPATDGEEGFVVFKTTEPGYFIVADK